MVDALKSGATNVVYDTLRQTAKTVGSGSGMLDKFFHQFGTIAGGSISPAKRTADAQTAFNAASSRLDVAIKRGDPAEIVKATKEMSEPRHTLAAMKVAEYAASLKGTAKDKAAALVKYGEKMKAEAKAAYAKNPQGMALQAAKLQQNMGESAFNYARALTKESTSVAVATEVHHGSSNGKNSPIGSVTSRAGGEAKGAERNPNYQPPAGNPNQVKRPGNGFGTDVDFNEKNFAGK